MNEAMQAILNRRSCRSYLPDQIREEDLQQILLAGSYAASGRGLQPVKVVVVQDPETIEELRRRNAAIWGKPHVDPFYGAPTVCVVLGDTDTYTWVEDGSLVLGNLMLAAEAVGAASCWINRARQEFDSPEGKALLAKWGIPERYRGVGYCILGYAASKPAAPKARRADFVHRV